MGAALAICAIVLAICTVIVLIVVRKDIKNQEWHESQKNKDKDNV